MNEREIAACYRQVIDKIDELLNNDSSCIIAIDGMCGSGKSYLADLLVQTYECIVFHMDDYFLPLDMRTEERLAQPGGNVHYERFKEEVLDPVMENRTVLYRPYICGEWKFGESITVKPKKLNIIEGSYCMHPVLNKAYDFKIFMEAEEKEQLKRILQRNGEDKLQQFINRWIPLENMYFNALKIRDVCDVIIDTTGL